VITTFLKRWYWRCRLWREPLPDGFDGEWYRERYPDVANAGIEPQLHYLRFGRAEGRDPNPHFSATGYRLSCPEAADVTDPLLHYEKTGRAAGYSPRPELQGAQPSLPDKPTLLVCAHQAGAELYGAERSLLDVLAGLNAVGTNLLVTLPSAINTDYVAQVQALAWRVVILPYGWWHAQRAPVAATQTYFEQLLESHRVAAVYANTLVLDEPLLAARRLNRPVVAHIRELPAHDQALCTLLGATPDAISARVRAQVDLPLVNSAYTARCLGLTEARVVPNCIDISRFSGLLGPAERGEPVTVGMISSNLPKKGLDDFVALARVLEFAAPEVRCRLFGPDNAHVDALRASSGTAKLPGNLECAGYVNRPQAALSQLDILVNLSHFQESFGRTALEAMAAGKPVIGYDWGALSELIEPGENGYLVALGDVEAVAERVSLLAGDARLRARLGQAGRRTASDRYSSRALEGALYNVLQDLTQF